VRAPEPLVRIADSMPYYLIPPPALWATAADAGSTPRKRPLSPGTPGDGEGPAASWGGRVSGTELLVGCSADSTAHDVPAGSRAPLLEVLSAALLARAAVRLADPAGGHFAPALLAELQALDVLGWACALRPPSGPLAPLVTAASPHDELPAAWAQLMRDMSALPPPGGAPGAAARSAAAPLADAFLLHALPALVQQLAAAPAGAAAGAPPLSPALRELLRGVSRCSFLAELPPPAARAALTALRLPETAGLVGSEAERLLALHACAGC
jgi:hypothetical protein